MANKIYALNRGIILFHNNLFTHVKSINVWFIQKTKRAFVAIWNVYIRTIDGRSIHGLFITMGSNVLLGAQVIISLFGAIPFIGESLALWIRGDYVISDATLNRFFAFHVIALPLLLFAVIYLHIAALHTVGSNNPDGVEIKANKNPDGTPVDGIPFHPYYTVKDIFGLAVFLTIFMFVVFFMPEFGGFFLEKDNFVPADPLKTPEHIVPVWYFTPFYAILRAIPDKLGGVIAMGLAIFVLFLMPWIDRCKVKSIRYRSSTYKILLASFVISFIGLGYIGMQAPTPILTALGRIFTLIYFAFFVVLYFTSNNEKTKPVPERVTMHE